MTVQRIRFEVSANARLNKARHGTAVDASPVAVEGSSFENE